MKCYVNMKIKLTDFMINESNVNAWGLFDKIENNRKLIGLCSQKSDCRRILK